MCSFATIYGLVKLSGGKFKIGLTYNQYIKLSEIFPYFEDELKENIIEGKVIYQGVLATVWMQLNLCYKFVIYTVNIYRHVIGIV